MYVCYYRLHCVITITHLLLNALLMLGMLTCKCILLVIYIHLYNWLNAFYCEINSKQVDVLPSKNQAMCKLNHC